MNPLLRSVLRPRVFVGGFGASAGKRHVQPEHRNPPAPEPVDPPVTATSGSAPRYDVYIKTDSDHKPSKPAGPRPRRNSIKHQLELIGCAARVMIAGVDYGYVLSALVSWAEDCLAFPAILDRFQQEARAVRAWPSDQCPRITGGPVCVDDLGRARLFAFEGIEY